MAPRTKRRDTRVPHPSVSKGAGVRRNPLVRYYGEGHLHFLTFSCYRRRRYLATQRARDRFLQILDQVRARWEFRLIGYVIMPEHVHLLISEPRKGNPSSVLQVLKQKTSRALRKRRRMTPGQLSLSFSGTPENETHFWQRRFYDFNVWSAKKLREKLREKLQYMHRNPVKRKLVRHPTHWPWSSWSHYETGEGGWHTLPSVGLITTAPAVGPAAVALAKAWVPHPLLSKGAEVRSMPKWRTAAKEPTPTLQKRLICFDC